MPLFTSVQSGDFDASATWDVGSGFPGAADTFSIVAGHVVVVPSGLSVTTTGLVTGSSTSNRGELVIVDGGKLTLNADLVMNNFNHLQVNGGGELDLNGNDILSVSSSSVYNKMTLVGTANNRAKISSSVVGVGDIRNTSGIDSYSVDFMSDYCDFVDCGRIMVGSNWYGGRGLVVRNTVFVGCDEVYLGGYHNAEGDFIIQGVDVRESRSTTANVALVRRANGSSTTGAGTKLIDRITATDSVNTSAVKFRWECKDIDRSNIVLEKLSNESVLYRGYTVSDSIQRLQPLYGIDTGGVDEIRDCYVISEQQNPHTGAATAVLFARGVIEATYSLEPWSDDGDHWVVGTGDSTIDGTLVIEEYSGVLANALGAARAGTYNVNNCTLYGNYNPVYGSLARTENFGSFTGVFNLQSNLVYSRLANARGFNIEDDTILDQVTLMDNNAWFNVSDRYFGVTSATKTPGVTVGYGGNDLVNVDPQFVDDTRNLAAWAGTVTGTATADAAMLHLLKINGYNETSKTQVPADVVAETPRSATDWVRAGFAPTNAAYQGTSHDGGDIGAIVVQAGGGGTTYEAVLSVSGVYSIAGSVFSNMQSGAVFNSVYADSSHAVAVFNAGAVLATTHAILNAPEGSAEGAIALSTSYAMNPVATAINEAITALSSGHAMDVLSGAVFAPDVVLNIDGQLGSIAGSNYNDAVSFVANAAIGADSLVSIEGELGLGVTAAMVSSVLAQLDADLSLDTTQALIVQALSELEAAAQLNQSHSVTVTRNSSDINCSVALSVTATINADGSTSLEITTPASRRFTLIATDRKFILKTTNGNLH